MVIRLLDVLYPDHTMTPPLLGETLKILYVLVSIAVELKKKKKKGIERTYGYSYDIYTNDPRTVK